MLAILVALFGVLFLIFFHELGHMLSARAVGIPVYAFAIGMGPKLVKWKDKHNTEWSIRLFPLGGFCSFKDPESLEREKELENQAKAEGRKYRPNLDGILDTSLSSAPHWKQIVVLFCGSGFNFLLAFLLALTVYVAAGEVIYVPRVTEVTGQAAEEAGIMEDDVILSIAGVPIDESTTPLASTIQEIVAENGNENIPIVVSRNENGVIVEKKLTATLYHDDEAQKWKIGLTQDVKRTPANPVDSIKNSFSDVWLWMSEIYRGIISIFTSKVDINNTIGVIGAVDVMSDYSTSNWFIFLPLLGLLSANLGVVNLLPIPALDGCKILVAIFEWITGKKISARVSIAVQLVSFGVLMLLMVIIAGNDILRIINNKG